MQPIDRTRETGADTGATLANGRGGIVLPRLLRKPVRQLRRLANGGFHVTRRGMAWSALAFMLVAGSAAFQVSGGGDVAMARLAPALGIAIREIDVSGNHEVSDAAVGQIVAPGNNISILGYDVAEAREKLLRHPWIKEATVSRVYPDKLNVEIIERTAHALWQSENGLQLINADGLVLEAYDGRDHSMPLVVGRSANLAAKDFIALMDRYPSIASQARAYIMVGERRWDVELANGVTIMLPEKNVENELAALVEADRQHALLSRDIRRVDLRIAERMVIKVSQEAKDLLIEKRKEQVEQLASSIKERNT